MLQGRLKRGKNGKRTMNNATITRKWQRTEVERGTERGRHGASGPMEQFVRRMTFVLPDDNAGP